MFLSTPKLSRIKKLFAEPGSSDGLLDVKGGRMNVMDGGRTPPFPDFKTFNKFTHCCYSRIFFSFFFRRMQRRAGRGQAHIAPPTQRSPVMGSESEKGSRLNQRNFGVTNRIWLIVSLFLFIIMFTHFVLPTHQPQQRTPYSATNLKPKNYLNGSDTDPNPFAFCPPYNPGDELGTKYGTQVLSKSRLHHGSGDRIQQVLNRALAGLPVTISMLGGSGAFVHYAPNGSF